MALNINGTTGISGVDGSASAPALTGTDSNTGINFASDTVNINTGGSTRATVDSSGNLGIGSTSPTDYDNAADNLVVKGTGNTGITIATTNTASNNSLAFSDGTGDSDSKFRGAVQYLHNGDVMRFLTASTERMRISGADVMVGCTSNDSNSSTGIRLLGAGTIHTTRNNEYGYVGRREGSDGGVFLFRRDANNVGSISVTYSGTSFNTSSDYRLKENVTAISDGITRLKTLKPSRFNFKTNKDLTVDGFLAHEVTAVPEAISGTKDAVATEDSEEAKKGDPIYQQIDQSKLVPLLTAALQEAVAKIEVLETKVAALEAG